MAGGTATAANNLAIAALTDLDRDEIGWVWLLRLAGSLLIIGAIVRENVGAR